MNQNIRNPQQENRVQSGQTQTTQAGDKKSKMFKIGKKKPLTLILVLLLLISLVTAGYFFKQYRDVKNNPSTVTAAETESLVKKVGVLITLPKDETPTIATVSDKEKLKDQPFFKNAQKDDKLLIYTNAKQAIIYRPSENKIINVGPIAINDAQPTDTPKSTPEPKQ